MSGKQTLIVLGAAALTIGTIYAIQELRRSRELESLGSADLSDLGWIPKRLLPWILPRWGGRRDYACWPVKRDWTLCREF